MSENSGLKVLLACARPLVTISQQPIPLHATRSGEEIEAVQRGLEGIRREINVTVHGAATLPEVNKLLMNAEPEFDVLHFMGHGDDETETLLFEGDCGIARQVTSDELARLIEERIRLLVVMACYSEKVVEPIFSDGKCSVAAAVCISGEHPVQIKAAELFSGALYSGPSRGKTLKRSFNDAVDAVRMDNTVGEAAMPETDGKPSPWQRFMLKGDENLSFPDIPTGGLQVEEIIQKSQHRKIARTNQLFVGRSAEIVAIAQRLEPPELGSREQKARIVSLIGEGGIGKTRLAQATADWLAERGKFPGGIVEIECETATNATELALAILKGMGIEAAENISDPTDALPVVLRGLRGRTLLLLDNLDDLFAQGADSGEAGKLLRECLTASQFLNILATCRWPLNLGADERYFALEPMPIIDAARLFIMCIPDEDIQSELETMKGNLAFMKIIELTGMMPLCVILAARRLLKHGQTLLSPLKDAANDLVKTMDDPKMKGLPPRLKSLEASLDLSYRHLSEPARQLFARMSFFPAGLFRGLQPLQKLLGENWAEAAEEIERCALARYDRDAERYTMLHPVMEYATRKLNEVGGDDFRHQAMVFWAEFSQQYDLLLDTSPTSQERVAQMLELPDDPNERQNLLAALRSQAFVAFTMEEENLVHTAEWAMGAEDEAGLQIVDSIVIYLELRKRWYTKERLYQLALEKRRKLAELNPEAYRPYVAMTLNNMGALHQNMGHPNEALKLYEEALEIYRRLAESHPEVYRSDVAGTLNNMGNLLNDMGHPDEALKPYEEALEIYRKLAESHPEVYRPYVAMTLNNMGNLHQNMGHPNKALKLYKEALEIRRELAESHPEAYGSYVATTLNNMGNLLNDMGHPDEALKLYEEALEIRRELAESHPEAYKPYVAMTLNSMGYLHQNMGHPDEALELYEEALEIRRELAESHPDAYRPYVATTLNNMGNLHQNMGHPDEALELYKEALEIRRELAELHPDAYRPYVATTLNNMGNLHQNMGHPDEALKLYEEALEIRRELAESHPEAYGSDVAMTLNNMGALLDNMGHPDEALKLYEEALEIYRELAELHPEAYRPDVAMTLNNMGNLLDDMVHPDEALKLYEEALEIRRELAKSHPEAYRPYVATTLNNMGALLDDMGHPDEALKLYEEALRIYKEFFGRYPSAYARNFMIVLRGTMEVYEKLKMRKKTRECREEIRKIEEYLESQ